MKDKLTYKQQAFVDCYTNNATEAAKLAGYKGNKVTLASVGKENLRKPLIIEAIEKREILVREKRIATREDRQRFWTKVMEENIALELINKDGKTEVVPGVDMKDRLTAARDLGKSEGDFLDRIEHSGGVQIVERRTNVPKREGR